MCVLSFEYSKQIYSINRINEALEMARGALTNFHFRLRFGGYFLGLAVLALAMIGGFSIQPALAKTIYVTSTSNDGTGSFRQALNDAGSGDSISFSRLAPGAKINLETALPRINLSINVDGTTKDGSGVIIDGQDKNYIFFVRPDDPAQKIDVNLKNMTLQNGHAKGGDGGTGNSGGGGGLGAGGAGFVGKGASLTVENIKISENTAQGGKGGKGGILDVRDQMSKVEQAKVIRFPLPFSVSGGGGGGLNGGNGGPASNSETGAGGGGGGFDSDGKDAASEVGGEGGGSNGGSGGDTTKSATSGGDYSGGGGGGKYGGDPGAPKQGGNGGFGGGGGGSGSDGSLEPNQSSTGDGGFGGGSGGSPMGKESMDKFENLKNGVTKPTEVGAIPVATSITLSGLPGFGGGGGGHGTGGYFYKRTTKSGVETSGNFGGGMGSPTTGNAGGGGGLGGGFFIEDGANLIIKGDSTVSGGTVTGGIGVDYNYTGSYSPEEAKRLQAEEKFEMPGQAEGSGIFLHGTSAMITAPGKGKVITISDDIASDGYNSKFDGLHGDGLGKGPKGIGNIEYLNLLGNLNPKISNRDPAADGIDGGVSIVEAGKTVLSGKNSYLGGTHMTVGTIEVNSDSNLGHSSGILTFAEGGTLLMTGSITNAREITTNAGGGIVNTQANSAEFNGSITGVGTITKIGSGSLSISSDKNRYGGNIVDEGVLIAKGENVYGYGILTVNKNGRAELSDFNQIVGEISGKGPIELGSAQLEIRQANPTVYEGLISGTGGIIKNGDATLTLASANSYSGGTTLGQGVLRIEHQQALAGGAVTGDGGGLSLADGVDLSNSLNLNQQTSIIVNDGDVALYSGAIIGAGGLTKQGNGVLSLPSDYDYSGPTKVNAGGLVVRGSAPNSDFTITRDAFLKGDGRVKSLDVFGVVNPESDTNYAQFKVDQDIILRDGSVYKVNIASDGSTDLILADGNISIESAAELEITATPGQYGKDQEYTIATARQGVSGSFGTVLISGLKAEVVYDPNNVKLKISDNEDLEIDDKGELEIDDKEELEISLCNDSTSVSDPNEQGVNRSVCMMAATAEGNADIEEFLSAYNSLDKAQLSAARQQLSGEGLGYLGTATLDNSYYMVDMVNRRLLNGGSADNRAIAKEYQGMEIAELSPQGGASGPVVPVVEEGSGGPVPMVGLEDGALAVKKIRKPISVWLAGYGGRSKFKRKSTRLGYKLTSAGGVAGIDIALRPSTIVGVAAGILASNLKLNHIPTSGTVKSYGALAYGRFQKGDFKVRGILGYRLDRLNSKRTIAFGQYAQTAKGKTSGKGYMGLLEMDYNVPNKFGDLSLFSGLSFAIVDNKNFTEKNGGATNLVIKTKKLNSARSKIGARFSKSFEVFKGYQITPEISLGWLRYFGDVVNSSIHQFSFSPEAFAVRHLKRNRNQLALTVRSTIRLNKTFESYLGYDGNFGKSWRQHAVVAGIKATW